LGLATLGDIALFYQAFNKGQGLLTSLLGNASKVYGNTLFLGSLFEFLELRPEIVSPPQPVPAPQLLQTGIHFREVTFRYPGSEQMVLADFNFFIPAGKIVAIVGANGAGKTTLVKLLCRFYDPQAGCIELDGIDLREISVTELRRMITVMLQFPVPYISTVTENIELGDLAAHTNGTTVESAAHSAGAHGFITRLPLGYETLLGKLFSTGVELSGGEWQRLALARSFLRQGSIMILDEPTSAMDSWAEIDWFDRFRELARGRTALLITHRFTTARRADVIHVMNKGRIVESGNHDQLLLKNGLYAQSWYAQTQSGNAPPG
jgi:ATP-binding cassette subfamily B protein